MEKISVILPTYNSSRYLKEALESILSQTYPIFEIIIVDDGSTDGTKEVINYMKSQAPSTKFQTNSKFQSPIKYFYQENKGPAAARNRGLKEAKGEYIAFLDTDDLWLPEKIEKQLALIKDSDYGMVYCDMSHEVDGKLIYKSYLKEKRYKGVGGGNIYEKLLKENFIFTPTVIIKKGVLDEIGYFDENYRICEDYKMWLEIARDHQVGYVDEVLVARRRNGTNITKDKFLYVTSQIRLFEKLLNDNSNDKTITSVLRTNLSKLFFNLGYYYWDINDMKFARKNFLKTGRCICLFYIIISYLPDFLRSFFRKLKRSIA